MLDRVEKRDPPILLVGRDVGTATMEKSMAVPQKTSCHMLVM